MDTNDLQANFENLSRRCTSKAAELHQAESELAGIVSRLVDATDKQRAAIITRRGELVNLRDVLRDELKELSSRREAAELAIYELAEAQAKSELERLAVIARDARQAMNTAADARLRYINRGGRNPQTDEDARELVRIETEQARTAAESQIAKKNAERARDEWQRAEQETAEVRARLGVPAK